MSDAGKEMKDLFITDSLEAIAKLDEFLLELEDSNDPEVIRDLFRAAHSIKGGALMMGYNHIADLAHAMETLLSQFREEQLIPSRQYVDALLQAVDWIKQRLSTDPEVPCESSELIIGLGVVSAESSPSSLPTESATPGATDDIALLLSMASDLGQKSDKRSADVPEKKQQTKGPDVTSSTIRVNVTKLNSIVNLASELVLARNQLLRNTEGVLSVTPGIQNILQNLNHVTTELQTEIISMRMQPMSLVFGKFPRIVRDVSAKLGKQIKLQVVGESVELDKSIIELLSDPLIQLVRNAIDHGIEKTDQRVKAGKSEEGTVTLRAFHADGLVHIEIEDDGRGLDSKKLIEKAIEKGILTQEKAVHLCHEEALNLIFEPGFSTAEIITDISGRGVGMDIVRSNIEKLSGVIDIETVAGVGTKFKIRLPLTLAIISSLIVESEGVSFAIPQGSFTEILRISSDDYEKHITTIEGGQIIRFRDQLLPLVHLADAVGLNRALDFPGETLRVLICNANGHFGLIVDRIEGFQEIIVKPMPMHLKYLGCYAGVTILGDSKIALIIDATGVARKNRLVFEKTKLIQKTHEKGSTYNEDLVSAIIFEDSKRNRFAVPIADIRRIDKINLKEIQCIENVEMITLLDEVTRVIRLDDHMASDLHSSTLQEASVESEEGVMIMLKNSRVPVGLLISQVIGSRNLAMKSEESPIESDFIHGTALVDGHITLFLNIEKLCRRAAPSLYSHSIDSAQTIKRRILYVEDAPLYQKMVNSYLSEAGYEVVLASDGEEAMNKLSVDDQFDLILTDIEMPGVNGFDFIHAIKTEDSFSETYRKKPVIALTTIHDEDSIKKGTRLGFNKWLMKLDKLELLKTIKELLDDADRVRGASL